MEAIFSPRALQPFYRTSTNKSSTLLMATVCAELDQPGCPICRLVSEGEIRRLESILWEQVTDFETIRRLLSVRGYCFEHSWALVAASERVYSHQGVAAITLYLIKDFLEAARQGALHGTRRWLRADDPCPVCMQSRRSVSSYGRALAQIYATDPSVVESSSALLCVPHLSLVTKHLPAPLNEEVRADVAARQHASLAGASSEQALTILAGRRPVVLPAEASCPACRKARTDVLSSVDGDTLCRLHAWTFAVDMPNRPVSRPFTTCSDETCPACRATREQAQTNVADAAEWDWLCLGHLLAALESPVAEAALPRAVRGIERLAGELERYRASADYLFTGELTRDEAGSWQTAIARVAGETPGIDLHATVDTRMAWWSRPWALVRRLRKKFSKDRYLTEAYNAC